MTGLLRDRVVLLIVFAGLALRLGLAASTGYIWDEDHDWICVAERISLEPGRLNPRIREGQHASLPAYLIRAGAMLVGHRPLGFRLFSLLAGALTILICAQLARAWAGLAAGRWTAVLLAFNEYHAGVSALAVEKVYQLLFVSLAVWALSCFQRRAASRLLYATGVATGLAFLCKEIAALVLPVFLLVLVSSPHRRWLARREPYLALALFGLVIAPDLHWNLTHTSPSGPRVGYAEHLARLGGPGLSPEPLVFFGRDVAYSLVPQEVDPAGEYPAMNVLQGVVLLTAVVWASFRWRDLTARLLLLLFWGVFGFFVLVRPRLSPRPELDDASWFWVDLTLLPAVVLAGAWLSELRPPWRGIGYGVAVGGLLLALASAGTHRLGLSPPQPPGPPALTAPGSASQNGQCPFGSHVSSSPAPAGVP